MKLVTILYSEDKANAEIASARSKITIALSTNATATVQLVGEKLIAHSDKIAKRDEEFFLSYDFSKESDDSSIIAIISVVKNMWTKLTAEKKNVIMNLVHDMLVSYAIYKKELMLKKA